MFPRAASLISNLLDQSTQDVTSSSPRKMCQQISEPAHAVCSFIFPSATSSYRPCCHLYIFIIAACLRCLVSQDIRGTPEERSNTDESPLLSRLCKSPASHLALCFRHTTQPWFVLDDYHDDEGIVVCVFSYLTSYIGNLLKKKGGHRAHLLYRLCGFWLFRWDLMEFRASGDLV